MINNVLESLNGLPLPGSLIGMSALALMALLMLSTLASEDLACVSAGLLAASGQLPLGLGIVACAIGIWIGDVGLYAVGRGVRRGLLQWPWVIRFVSPARLAVGERFFAQNGTRFLFASRFLPGSRLPGYLAAGALRYPLWKFMLILAIGAIVWAPLLCLLALSLGMSILPWLHDWRLWLAVPFVWLVIGLAGQLAVGLMTWRGRRLLLSRWMRLTQWEFWPGWAFYPPVALWFIWLGIKHRSLTVFTLCNPGIRFGGLVMESKSAILTALGAQNLHSSAIATWTLLVPGETSDRVAALHGFMTAHDLAYPIVLKPDIGERGQGVAIVRDEQAAQRYLAFCRQGVIAQRYIEGLEFGVFYCRQPGDKTGRIVSLSQKHLFSLHGDGVSTLEELIFTHPRALAMAPYYMKKFAERLSEVPAFGVEVKLAEIGTHCRGAIFTDARRHLTEDLCREIDALTQPFVGFHYGRYDLRVPSLEDLKAGRHFQVLELNGVTAEPVHVYQPGYPLWRGWQDVCACWSAAFAAGAAIRSTGHPAPRIRDVIAELKKHRHHAWFEADDLLKKSNPSPITHPQPLSPIKTL